MYTNFEVLKAHDLREVKIYCLTHHTYHRPNVVLETIKNFFIQEENIYQYNTKYKRDFHAAPINIATYGKRTMAYKGRNLWNQLPKDFKETNLAFAVFYCYYVLYESLCLYCLYFRLQLE